MPDSAPPSGAAPYPQQNAPSTLHPLSRRAGRGGRGALSRTVLAQPRKDPASSGEAEGKDRTLVVIEGIAARGETQTHHTEVAAVAAVKATPGAVADGLQTETKRPPQGQMQHQQEAI